MARISIEELADQANELRTDFTKLREDGEELLREGRASEAADKFASALAKMESAIELCRRSGYIATIDTPGRKVANDDEKKLVKLYADSLGRAGGLLRRLGRVSDARDSYKAGSTYEKDARFRHIDSYNTVNHIVVQLELNDIEVEGLAADIEQAVTMLINQTRGVRYQQSWAYADLGQCLLLAGRLGEAEKAYGDYVRLAVPKDIGSTLRILAALAKRLRETGDRAAGYIQSGIDTLTAIARAKDKLPAET